MTYILYLNYLEEIMRRAAMAGLLLFAAVFMISVIWGWAAGMAIGCLIVGLTILVDRRK